MEAMEKADDASLCRLCDEKTEQMHSIFDKNEEGNQILNLIKECLPVIVYRTDPLSKQICEKCFNKLNTLYDFKQTSVNTAKKHKEQLITNSDNEKQDNVQLFLDCDGENVDIRENNGTITNDDVPTEKESLCDASTSTDDLTILCLNCKQAILDASTINGEVELCADLHKALADSLRKNKVISETESEKVLRSRRRKTQPFYHELDDSLCSSLTEFTNTESSQCYDMSDVESVDSDTVQHPPKRRRIYTEDDDSERGLIVIKQPTKKDLESIYNQEPEYRYAPLSLLELALNVINKMNVPEFEGNDFYLVPYEPECTYCKQKFKNNKILAMHEEQHMDIELGEKIDHPLPWHEAREDADVRNKWLNYFDENGFDEDDVVIEASESLLIPVDSMDRDPDNDEMDEQMEDIVLVGTTAMVKGVPLSDFTKEERKAFYPSMRIAGINKKFCKLCRYSFKDNWAIESHYFSLACYYTCRYCGMRFNKQRHRFTEHVDVHIQQGHIISDKIFAASKLNNVVPKIIAPDKIKTSSYASSNEDVKIQPIKMKSLMQRKSLQPNLMAKEEMPSFNMMQQTETKDIITSQSKTGNQAFFCRKCYKVFFKLDEFNIHSKNCDYNQFPPTKPPPKQSYYKQQQQSHRNTPPVVHNTGSNGDVVSPAGRPMRNCVKEIGTYKDEAYIPEALLKETVKSPSQQSFVCFICNTPFPTIYSRNSHMRIHKGETNANSPSTSQKYRQNNYQLPQQQHHQQQQNHNLSPIETAFMNFDTRIKQEPLEPEVEIHEAEQNFGSSIGGGAVSITPISKNPQQKATINPNIMKLVQNNPHLTIKKSPEKYSMPGSSQMMNMANNDPDRSYKCSSCWEAFANKSHLYFHKKNQCEGSRFPCPFCKKRFGTEAAYSSHIFYSHPE